MYDGDLVSFGATNYFRDYGEELGDRVWWLGSPLFSDDVYPDTNYNSKYSIETHRRLRNIIRNEVIKDIYNNQHDVFNCGIEHGREEFLPSDMNLDIFL